MLTAVKNRIATMFTSGYDAVASTGKRKAASAVLKYEDEQLKHRDRKKIIGTGRDLVRNYSAVSWVIRKHLDYCTQFDFQVRTDSDELNQQIEDLVKVQSSSHNCDQAQRHPFPRLMRMLEGRRVIDGDVFLVKRSSGRLQAVESELIADPDDIKRDQRWFNGCNVDADGRALGWGLHKRGEHGLNEFLKRVPARNMIQHACFDSSFRFDQVRGVSPLACAFNSFRDLYEGIDFALAKMKVEQLFAMVITDSATDGIGETIKSGNDYTVDFGKGPVKLELEPGEDAKFLKTDNPGSDTQDFLHLVLGMALKALDIPFSFYKEDFTNFFGSKSAFMQYERSCSAKRADVIEVLRQITIWWMRIWISRGLLTLPAGMTINDVTFEWIPIGMPWWDPAKEIKGDVMAIAAGLDSPQRVCRRTGTDFEENIKQIAKAKAIAESMGVEVSFVPEEAEQLNVPDDNSGDTDE